MNKFALSLGLGLALTFGLASTGHAQTYPVPHFGAATRIDGPSAAIVNRTMASHFADTTDPRDFGAYCDGTSHVLSGITSLQNAKGALNTAGWSIAQWQAGGWPHATDTAQEMDGAAIQEAEYALSALTGGRIKLPSGCFVNRTIHVIRPYTTISGDGGFGGSIYTYPAHNFNLFSNDAPGNTYASFAINPGGTGGPGGGFAVAPADGTTEVFAIYDPYVALATPVFGATLNNRMTVHDVEIQTVWSGILSGGGDDLINVVHMRGNGGPVGATGVVWDTPYVDTRQLWNSSVSGFTYGYRALGAGASIDVNNTELYNNTICANHVPAAGMAQVSIYWTHVFCDTTNSATGGAVFDARATGSAITRVSIQNSWFGGNSTGSGSFWAGNVRGVSIGGGTQIFGNNGDGISIDASVGNAAGFNVANVQDAGNTGSGVSIGSGVSGWSLTNNVLGPAADFGANGFAYYIVGGTTDYYRILGNDTHGNTNVPVVGAFSGSGGTHTAVGNNL